MVTCMCTTYNKILVSPYTALSPPFQNSQLTGEPKLFKDILNISYDSQDPDETVLASYSLSQSEWQQLPNKLEHEPLLTNKGHLCITARNPGPKWTVSVQNNKGHLYNGQNFVHQAIEAVYIT